MLIQFAAAVILSFSYAHAGGLDKAVIDETVKRRLPMLRACYDREVKRGHKDLAGNVSMKFIIGPEGKVTEAKAENSTLNNAEVEACLAKVVKETEFPQPEGGGVVEVSYPFAFSQKLEGKKAKKKGK